MDKFWSLFSKALSSRTSLGDVFRIFDGTSDGIPSLYADKIGSLLLVHELVGTKLTTDFEEKLRNPTEDFLSRSHVRSIYLRRHFPQARESAKNDAILCYGDHCPEHIAEENGVRFFARPEANVNAGVFLDMREVRARLLKESSNKRVLNLFCFTGLLGVAAHVGGASEVVQVDVSKGILTWARSNFELNKKVDTMRFIPEDALTFVEREVRRIESGRSRYDTVIIDPPSFGSSKKGAFSFEKSIPDLVRNAALLLTEAGTLILTTNNSAYDVGKLKHLVLSTVKEGKWRAKSILPLYPPQVDFRAQGRDSIAMRGVWASSV